MFHNFSLPIRKLMNLISNPAGNKKSRFQREAA
jgi:hypothetical protein